MRDGVTLAADLYRPKGEGKFPVLVEHMVVRGNLIENLRHGQNCDGDALLVSRAHHMDIHDNTFRNIPRAAFRAGSTTPRACPTPTSTSGATRSAPPHAG